ncbi:MAG: TetR/AcrR family transcriptional regulator [Verrucomicrobium sp.]|nr:TetR/AcrR family transcriptional regulator [Verrucomicrobium sp.]
MPKITLREEQAALAQHRIMQAVAQILTATGEDVTFRSVSLAAKIPERTLYRCYPTKDALMEAFWLWLNGQLGMPDPPRSAEELVAQIPALYAAFEKGDSMVRAMLHDNSGRATRLAQAPTRRKRFQEALKDVLKPLQAPHQRRLLASVQLLASASGWETMKDQWGLSGPQAADAAQWAIKALLDQAANEVLSSPATRPSKPKRIK